MSIIPQLFKRKQAFADKSAAIANSLPNAIVITADPSTDVITVAFKGELVTMQVKHKNGSKMNLVKHLLNYSNWEMRGLTPDVKDTLDKNIDQFLLHIGDALCSISKKLYDERNPKVEQNLELQPSNG